MKIKCWTVCVWVLWILSGACGPATPYGVSSATPQQVPAPPLSAEPVPVVVPSNPESPAVNSPGNNPVTHKTSAGASFNPSLAQKLPLAQQIQMRIGQGWPGRAGFMDPGFSIPIQTAQDAILHLKSTLSSQFTFIWSYDLPEVASQVRAAHFVFQAYGMNNGEFEVGIPITVCREIEKGIWYIPVSELLALLKTRGLVLSETCLYQLRITLDMGSLGAQILQVNFRLKLE